VKSDLFRGDESGEEIEVPGGIADRPLSEASLSLRERPDRDAPLIRTSPLVGSSRRPVVVRRVDFPVGSLGPDVLRRIGGKRVEENT
jgi:hypothetical protein